MKVKAKWLIATSGFVLALITVLITISKGGSNAVSNFNRKYWGELIAHSVITENFIPEDIRTFGDNIYLLNFRQNKIVETREDGQIYNTYDVDSIVQPPGSGLRGAIVDFDVDPSGLSFAIARTNSVAQIGHNGKLVYKQHTRPFSRCVAVGNGTFLFREFTAGPKLSQAFIFRSFPSFDSVLPVQSLPYNNDGGLSSDGFFVKTPKGDLVYLAYYLNIFFYFKQTTLEYKGTTIDGSLDGPSVMALPGNVYTLKKNIQTTHKAACCSRSSLLVASSQIAENHQQFVKHSGTVIDVYNLNNGAYNTSFIIPDYKGYKVSALQCLKDFILAVQGNSIVFYKLPNYL